MSLCNVKNEDLKMEVEVVVIMTTVLGMMKYMKAKRKGVDGNMNI